MSKKVAYIVGGILLTLLVVGSAWAWIVFRVEDVPGQLDAMERSPDEVVVSAVGNGEDLHFASLRGHKSVIVFEGVQSMQGEEGKEVNRALYRWLLPDDVQGYIVWDGEGMRIFEEKASKFVGFFSQEVRFPVYVDFDGEVLDVFKLTKGHHGLIVLGPQGEVLMRHSGGLEASELDELRTLLDAEEPPEPPPAPPFSVAGIDNDDCRDKPCLFIFMGEPVARADIPWVEDGFEGTRTECFERMRRPEIRLAASAMRVPITKSHGILMGEVEDLDLKGWTVVSDEPAAREAFGLGPEESALVVVDTEGRLAFRETGFIPMYRWTLAVDHTGEEILREDED
ncbi:MAG: hypothetical protein KC501_15410 [Myxococcales bacterium]|nr:hypothetical protein [Myxococcales bacterium]